MLSQALILLGGGFLVGLLAGIALVRSEAHSPAPSERSRGVRARGQAARPSAPCQCTLCRTPGRTRHPINGGRWL